MKALKFVTIPVLFVHLACSLTSCKKDKDVQPQCRIITVTPTAGDAINITYNDEGKMATVAVGSTITSWSYSGNTAIGTTTTNGQVFDRRIVTSNSNGMTTNMRIEMDETGNNWTNQAFEYSGTELIKSTATSSAFGEPAISIYTWSGGNLASVTSGGSTTSVDYYFDKPSQPGDFLLLNQMTQGYFIFKNKNLIKSILSGNFINGFAYSFGPDNRISSVTSTTDFSTITHNFQYQCN